MPVPYRADIDGLRAVAIVSVVTYHAAPALLPGGFIGVDVFFVISGFLISSIIFKETAQKRFSLLSFYERRFRRILPALFVVVLASLVCGAVLFSPPDYFKLGRSATAATAFFSNFYFAKQVGYFAPAAETQALLHTWSLAVEEQFYLVIPVLLAALSGRLRRYRDLVLFVLFIASLAAALHAVQIESPSAFFQPHLRAYEFLIGVFVAQPPWRIERAWMKEVGAVTGALALAGGLFLIDADTPFPGAAALIPCVGAALLISTSDSSRLTFTGKWLATAPAVKIGRVSYSLYLWHWPVLAFAHYENGGRLTGLQSLLCVALALALSVASYVFVETPWRRKDVKSRAAVFLMAVLGTAGMVAAAQTIVLTQGLPGRLSPKAAALAREIQAEARTLDLCGFRASERDRAATCVIGASAPDKRRFILWGDSHAGSLSQAYEAAADAAGLKGYFIGRAGCAPLFAMATLAGEPPRCRAGVQAFREALDDPDVENVILVARWGMYAEASAPESETRPRPFVRGDTELNRAAFAGYLEDTVRQIRARGKTVTLLGPVPELPVSAPAELVKSVMRDQPREVTMTRETFMARQAATLRIFARLAQEAGVRAFYPHELLCSPEVCWGSRNGFPLYVDNNHLNSHGARMINQMIQESLQARN